MWVCVYRGRGIVNMEKEKENFEAGLCAQNSCYCRIIHFDLETDIYVSVKVNGATEGYITEDYVSFQGSRWSQYTVAIVAS